MIALTVPEVRRLAQALAGPAEELPARLRWSRWRRRHQATAARCHAARRARRHPPPVGQVAPLVAVPGTPALTDARWERVAPRLPAPAGRRGRRPIEHRRILGGMLWVMRTGAAWREAPAEFGPWQTLYSRYTHWQGVGAWASILEALLADPPQAAATS
jgi:transposase